MGRSNRIKARTRLGLSRAASGYLDGLINAAARDSSLYLPGRRLSQHLALSVGRSRRAIFWIHPGDSSWTIKTR